MFDVYRGYWYELFFDLKDLVLNAYTFFASAWNFLVIPIGDFPTYFNMTESATDIFNLLVDLIGLPFAVFGFYIDDISFIDFIFTDALIVAVIVAVLGSIAKLADAIAPTT